MSVLLLASVVIGCLGFMAFQWWVSLEDSHASTTAHGLARFLVDDPIPSRAAAQQSVPATLRQIQTDVAQLGELEANVATSGKQVRGPLPLVGRVDQAVQTLRDAPQATNEQLRAARSAQLEAYFYAAQLVPKLYREPFDKLAASLAAYALGSNATQIEILRFLVDRDLSMPLDDAAVQQIEAKSKSFPNELHGVALYAIVARKLATRGQVASAIALLERSLVQYDGKPGRRQLLDQLIALRQPPPSQGMGAFGGQNEKQRAGSGYRGNVWRPSSLDPEIFQKEWQEKVERDHAIQNGL